MTNVPGRSALGSAFFPSTLGDDGDPLDLLILMEALGCVLRTRFTGGIEAKQKEKGEDWTKNDRLIAVATHAQTYQSAKTLSDLRPEITEFFVDYNRLRDRKFKPGYAQSPA